MAANSAYLSHPFNTSVISSSLAIAMGLSLAPQAMADDSELANIERLEVHGQQTENRNTLGSAENLLKGQGVDFSEAGGVSALPILNGMMGDRIKVLVDGADITASCANQMNPPLSYISANQVTTAEVIAGVSPVSAGATISRG